MWNEGRNEVSPGQSSSSVLDDVWHLQLQYNLAYLEVFRFLSAFGVIEELGYSSLEICSAIFDICHALLIKF